MIHFRESGAVSNADFSFRWEGATAGARYADGEIESFERGVQRRVRMINEEYVRRLYGGM